MAHDAAKSESAEPDVPPVGRRAWYRLHRSTWVVVFLGFVVLTAIIWPGACVFEAYEKGSVYANSSPELLVHGWPCYFYIQTNETGGVCPGQWPPWSVGECWLLHGETASFSWKGLVVDFLIVFLVEALAALYFERRRRCGLRLWQYSLREILACMFLVAVALSYWQIYRMRNGKEATLASAGTITYVNRKQICECPVLLRRIFGDGQLECFFQTHSLELIVKMNSGSREEAEWPRLLESLPYITNLCIGAENSLIINSDQSWGYTIQSLLMNALEHCTRLRRFQGGAISNAAALCRSLAGLPELEEITFSNLILTGTDVKVLASMSRLRRLHFSGVTLTAEALGALTQMKQLRQLDLESIFTIDVLPDPFDLNEFLLRRRTLTQEEQRHLKEALPECRFNWVNPLF